MSRSAAALNRVIKAYDVRGLVGTELDESLYVRERFFAGKLFPDFRKWRRRGRRGRGWTEPRLLGGGRSGIGLPSGFRGDWREWRRFAAIEKKRAASKQRDQSAIGNQQSQIRYACSCGNPITPSTRCKSSRP